MSPAPDRRRYPGVRSFEETESGRFFGRERASEELVMRVLSVKLLLQFAPSGAGKTSLLNAGLFPRLRPRGYLPFSVRLNEPDETLIGAVTRSLCEAARTGGLRDPVIPGDASNLWDLLSRVQLFSSQLVLLTPVIVFDQFEEVFTLHDAAFREAFAREIGELTRGRQTLSAHEDAAPNVKVIISLREEYLGALEEMSAAIPDLFRERMRLLPLTNAEAREAMQEPAHLPGAWYSPQFEFGKDCLNDLIDFIDGVSDRVRIIETLTLQLVCQRAEEIARAKPGGPIELALADFGGLPGLESLVSNYYNDVLAKLPDGDTRAKVVKLFERGLLDAAGKRRMLEQEDIERQYELSHATLNTLVAAHILRREPRNESVFYEISHDRLTEVIAKHRTTPMPRWVRPTLAAGLAVIIALCGALYFILEERAKTENSRQQTAQALDVLFADELTIQMQDSGLIGSVALALSKAPLEDGDSYDAYRSAHHLRLRGEVAWERSTLDQALENHSEALEEIDRAIAEGHGSTRLLAERARVLHSLGGVAMDLGEVTRGAAHYDAAIEAWQAVPKGDLERDPLMQLMAIDARRAHGYAQQRLGNLTTAENDYDETARLALNVALAAYRERARRAGQNAFVLGRALQLFSDGVVSKAVLWQDENAYRIARSLARESLRLRPLSAWARARLGTASAMYGALLMSNADGESAKYLEESHRQFRELTEFDPDSRRMIRDRAAVQLLSAEAISRCAEDAACRKTLRNGELESAESVALDASGRFQELAELDPESRALRGDIAWGKQVQARLRGARGYQAQAMAHIDDALRIAQANLVDPNDNESIVAIVDIMQMRAKTLRDSGDLNGALAALDESMTRSETMPSELYRQWMRANALLEKERILRVSGRTAEADDVASEANRLMAQLSKVQNARGDAERELLAAGDAQIEAAAKAPDLEKAQAYELAAEKFRAAIRINPGNAGLWRRLRNSCVGAANAITNAAGTVPLEERSRREQAEAALRCALEASWIESVFTDDADQARPFEMLRQRYEDRRSLALLLRDDPVDAYEALALADEGVREVEQLVSGSRSAETLWLAADAHYGLGLMRAQAERSGWDQSLRAAIVRGEQLCEFEPKTFAHEIWVALARNQLAKQLKSRQDPASEEELALADAACKRAGTFAKTDSQRQMAAGCEAPR